MDTNILFKTNNNNYLYNLKEMQFYYMNPIMTILYEFYKEFGIVSEDIYNYYEYNKRIIALSLTKKEVLYYIKKINFYMNNNIISKSHTEPKINWEKISPQLMKYQVINTKVLLFEVTEKCNLDCVYCGYNELYIQDEHRKSTSLTFKKAKILIDELITLWTNNITSSNNKRVLVGFYGGEPLLNFGVIKEIVEYLQNINQTGLTFDFRMTTNATLLKKYIKFLIKNNFRILISLDGDRFANSFRIMKNGNESFSRVKMNVDYVFNNHSEYFDKYVHFNSVLTSRTSFLKTHDFIKSNYGKATSISALAGSNVNEEKKELYKKIYKNRDRSYIEALKSDPKNEFFNKTLYVPRLESFLKAHLKLRVFNINEILYRSSLPFVRARGCLPFSLKIFLSSRGDLLPCEKIDSKFAFGNISKSPIFDYNLIAQKYKNYLDSLFDQCNKCYKSGKCGYCLFLSNEVKGKLICPEYMNKSRFNNFLSDKFSILEDSESILYEN